MDELVAKSLLRRDDEGRLSLHDLQYDYITKQVDDLTELHQRLLEAYQSATEQGTGMGAYQDSEQGWATVPADGYFYTQAARHFVNAGQPDALKALLLDYDWLARKLEVTSVNSLIADYDYLSHDPDLTLVQKTLRLSAHVLSRLPNQLTERLWGHLCGRDQAAIQQLLSQAAQHKQHDWLRPVRSNLIAPDGALLRTLEGHSARVNSVALSGDGRRAISGSSDRTVMVWDLQTGAALHRLEGHRDRVTSVALSGDGRRAISGSDDRTVMVWDLQTGVCLAAFYGDSPFTHVAVTPDGVTVVAGDLRGGVHFFVVQEEGKERGERREEIEDRR